MPPTAAPQTRPDERAPLRDALLALQRRLSILVIVVVTITTAAVVYSLKADKQYSATAKLLFRDPGFDQKLFGSPFLAPSADPNREAATNVSLVSLDTISGRVATALGRVELTPDEIRKRVQVVAQGQSDLIAVLATDSTPDRAAGLANAVARQYIRFRRDADRSKIDQAARLLRGQIRRLNPAQRDGLAGKSLRDQVEQLKVLSSLQTGNAELVQPALAPTDPSAPRPVRNGIVGLLFGLALGVGLALLLDKLDRRLRSRSDAEAILGRPVVGVIPESRALSTDGGQALHLSGQEGEAFRTLRTNLRYYDIDRNLRSLLVTSSAPGDGKSTVARYLAATAAASGVRAILVEADLRRPTLKAVFGRLRSRGLTEVLADQLALDDAIQQLPLVVVGQPEGRTLDVLAAGAVPPNPADLLDSERMRSVLSELEARYELVIVDTAPITVVPDSVPILGVVSGVVIVVREGKSTRVAARTLRRQLDHLDIGALGVVVNGATSGIGGAGYEYYGYGSNAPAAPEPELAPALAPAPANADSSNGARASRWPRLPRRDKTRAD